MRAGITIGVPIYRGKLFLEDSLASVRNQPVEEHRAGFYVALGEAYRLLGDRERR